MINTKNSSLFKFFVIFSMNFAWIGNVFSFSGSKKDNYTAKRISKSVFKTNALINSTAVQKFQLKSLEQAIAIEIKPLLTDHAGLATPQNNNYPSLTGTGRAIKEMLFPHHGFW